MQRNLLRKVDGVPVGTILTQTGYDIIRMNGDMATGYITPDNIYYEQVVHPSGTVEWFTDMPIVEIGVPIYGGMGFC
jgi:hypothetical protein